MKRSDFFKGAAAVLGSLTLSPGLKGGPLRRTFEEAAVAGDEALWRVVRDQFILDPELTYLNFGGLGSMPLPVIRSLEQWSKAEERCPGPSVDESHWVRAKEKLARLVGASARPEDFALVGSATEGINMILNGLPLAEGDEVITSTHEHVSLAAALLNRKRSAGIVIRPFDPDPRKGSGNIDRIAGLVNSRTRLIFLSHVTCTTGQVFPVGDIAALARKKGIRFALDGAQAPACVPFDLVKDGVDFYAASGHKWMMGPKRTGFLYVRPESLGALHPVTVGAGSVCRADLVDDVFELTPGAGRFEYGTQNEALFYALGTAVDFLEAVGFDRVYRHNRGLAEAFYAGLREIPGVEVLSPEEEAFRSPMISFRLPGRDMESVHNRLMAERIRIRMVTENDLNCIRVSFSLCNTADEAEKILASVKTLA